MPIAGFPGYEISNYGGLKLGGKPDIVMKTASGRCWTVLKKAGEPRLIKVDIAVIVAEHFVGPRPSGHVVRFKDGDSLNIHDSNLVWAERGVWMRGEDHPASKVTKDVAREILEYYDGLKSKWGAIAKLARMFGLSRLTVHNIVNGNHWSSRESAEVPKAKRR